MPITAAKGQINICLESLTNPGMYNLSNNVAVTATITPTNAIPATPTTAQRVVVWVMGNTALGTFTINGTGPGGTVTEGPISVPASNPAAQSAVIGKFEYESTNLLTTLTSITTTGLTNGTVSIWAFPGGKYLTPGILKSKKKFDKHSPNEHRNLLDKDTKSMQTLNKVTVDEFSQNMYPENSMWVAYMATGSVPTVTTLPATPLAMAGPLTVSTSGQSLAGSLAQPTAPGMIVCFVATSVPGSTGQITISGTNNYGVATSETVNVPSNGTFYSANVYKNCSAINVVGTTLAGASITIQGVYGWQYVFLPGDVVYSATLEKYTGVDSFSLPWFCVDEATFEFGMDKEFKLNTKGIAQDRIVIGDRTASSLNANRVTAIGQPGDLPMVGWTSLVYIDTTVGAAPTTTFGDLLEGKIQLKVPQKGGWTATNSQNYNRVNRGKRETMFDGKIDLTNVLQLEQYRQNLIQYITFQMLGQAIGGGYNKMWQFTFPVRWEDFDIVSTPDMERVEATVKALAEYDGGLGGSYRLTIINQQPPTYTI